MRVLVTGGAGFIGSHVVEHLRTAGLRPLVLDDFSSGRRDNVPPAVRLIEADVCDAGDVRSVVRRERPGVVMHLAAQVNVRDSIGDPAGDARRNILGAINVFRAAAEGGAQRIVFASSGAVYGEQRAVPCAETAPPRPVAPYGIAKLAAENYERYFAGRHGVDAVTLRLANVYGPRQDPGGEAGAAAIFASRLLDGRAPLVFGDGQQTRDFVHVDDVARAFVLALVCRAGTYNIGTGRETRVSELLELIQEFTGVRGRVHHRQAIQGELRRNALDCRRAGRALKWKPVVTLREGLRRTVEHFSSSRNGRARAVAVAAAPRYSEA